MSALGAFRLALATLMIGLGLTIIGRVLWLALAQGLALSSLFLPIAVGVLMVGLGAGRWRLWLRLHRAGRPRGSGGRWRRGHGGGQALEPGGHWGGRR